MTPERWSDPDQHCKEAAERIHQVTKERQIGKFSRLQSQLSSSRPTLDPSRLVVNRSSRILYHIEKDVLALGMAFAVTPRRIPHEEIITATEALARGLDQQTTDTL